MPHPNDFDKIEEWTAANIHAAAKAASGISGVKPRDYYGGLNEAITGKSSAPDIGKIMEVIGKEECIKRIKDYLLKILFEAFSSPPEHEE